MVVFSCVPLHKVFFFSLKHKLRRRLLHLRITCLSTALFFDDMTKVIVKGSWSIVNWCGALTVHLQCLYLYLEEFIFKGFVFTYWFTWTDSIVKYTLAEHTMSLSYTQSLTNRVSICKVFVLFATVSKLFKDHCFFRRDGIWKMTKY